MQRVERLLNLVALLLDTRRPLTAGRIRDAVYADQGDVAFRRMFERDKEQLRELGLPVERVPVDAWEVEEGYLIRPEDATLPDLGLTPDEQAALWLAARAWRGPGASTDAALGALKLAAASAGPGDGGPAPEPGWLDPRVDTDANLGPLLDAIARRKRTTFRYRTGGAGPAATRAVHPYVLRYRGGWYLTGHDEDRGEVRHYKLARMDGAVSVAAGRAPDFAAPAESVPSIPRGPWDGDAGAEARVLFGPKAAWWVERRTGARRVDERADGWIELAVPMGDAAAFVGWVLGFADDAEVLAPESLRREVVRRLEELAGAG